MFGPSDSTPLSLSLHGHCPSISLSSVFPSLCPRHTLPLVFPSLCPLVRTLSLQPPLLLSLFFSFPFSLSLTHHPPPPPQQVRLFIILILFNFPPAESPMIFTQIPPIATIGPEQRQIKYFVKWCYKDKIKTDVIKFLESKKLLKIPIQNQLP